MTSFLDLSKLEIKAAAKQVVPNTQAGLKLHYDK